MGRVQGRLAVARSFGDIEMKNADTGEPKFLTPEPGSYQTSCNMLKVLYYLVSML
jgi:hypothetical protein